MQRVIKNIFFKNFFNLSLTQLFNIFFTLIITPILFQRLGDEQFGIINLYFTVVMLLVVFVNYGYNLNGPKRIAVDSDKTSFQKLINEVISVRIILGIIIFSLSLIISFFLKLNQSSQLILSFSLMIILSESINPIFYFQGKDNLKGVTFSNFLFKISYLTLILFFVKNSNQAYLVNFFYGISSLFINIFFWIYIFRIEKLDWLWINSINFFKRINENIHFTLSSLAGYLSISSSLIIIYFFVDNKELGQFSIAQKIGLLIRMLPVFITQSVLQIASRKNNDNLEEFNNYISRVNKIGLVASFLLALILCFFSKWIIYVLAGKFIVYSQLILCILAFVPFLSMLNFKNMVIFLVNERKRSLNLSTWIVALFMIFSGSSMSYLYGGYGMAFSLLLSELLNYFLCSWLILKTHRK